jgi:glycerate dehydrogenase
MKNVLVHFKTDQEIKTLLAQRLGEKARVFHIEGPRATLSDIHILLTSNRTLGGDPQIIGEMGNLELIQSVTAGVERFPFHLIKQGIIVCSASGALSRAIAEHAFALILALAKNIVCHTKAMREGTFDNSVQSKELLGKVIGILGFGSIGREIARIARGFAMKVFAINRSGRTDFDCDFIGTLADLDHILTKSDVIVISLPLTKTTEGLIGRHELERMKEDAILVNIARAGIIEQGDLYRHLRDNPRFKAASDVWWRYPEDRRGGTSRQDHPFHQLGNFLMTPHVATHVVGARKRMFEVAVENIRRYLNGEELMNIVRREDYL